MRGIKLELTGQRFGKLVAIRPCGHAGTQVLWLCECDCGNTSTPRGTLLVTGKTKSCGCRKGFHKHGMCLGGPKTPEYTTWIAMKRRCYYTKHKSYKWYGGRGIKICDEWKNDFQAFYDYMGPRDITQSIDRIDNDGNYEPDNVRWVSKAENARKSNIKKMHKDNK